MHSNRSFTVQYGNSPETMMYKMYVMYDRCDDIFPYGNDVGKYPKDDQGVCLPSNVIKQKAVIVANFAVTCSCVDFHNHIWCRPVTAKLTSHRLSFGFQFIVPGM